MELQCQCDQPHGGEHDQQPHGDAGGMAGVLESGVAAAAAAVECQ